MITWGYLLEIKINKRKTKILFNRVVCLFVVVVVVDYTSFLPCKKLFSFTWNWEAGYPGIPLDIICAKDQLIFSHAHAINNLLRFSSRRFFKCDTRRTDNRTAVTASMRWCFRMDLSKAIRRRRRRHHHHHHHHHHQHHPTHHHHHHHYQHHHHPYHHQFSKERIIDFYFNFHCLLVSLTSCSSCLHLDPRLPFNKMFYNAVPSQDVTNPVSLPSFYCSRIFVSSLKSCNTLSFLTQSVQMFPIHLQQHISKLSVISDPLSEVSNYCIVHVFRNCTCGRSFNSFLP